MDGPLEAAIRDLSAPGLERLPDALLDLPDVEALRQRVDALAGKKSRRDPPIRRLCHSRGRPGNDEIAFVT